MKQLLRLAFAVILAVGTSLAAAQIAPYGGNLPIGAGLGDPLSSPLSPYGSATSGSTGLPYTTTPLPLTPNRSSVSTSTALGYAAPSPLIPGEGGPMAVHATPATHYPVVNCHPGGCSGVDGTQYARGAGNVMFGSNGKVCQYVAPGAPLVCN